MQAWRSGILAVLTGALIGMMAVPFGAAMGLAGQAGSDDLTAELSVQGSTRLYGWADLQADAAAISFKPAEDADAPTPEFSGEFREARVQWLGLPRSRVDLDPAPVGPASSPGRAETWRDEVITGHFHIESWYEDAFILVVPAVQGQVLPWRILGPLNATVQPPPGSPSATPIDFWSPELRRPLVYPGEAIRLTDGGSLNTTLDGPMLLAIYGAEIVVSDGVHDRHIVTGEQVSPHESVILPTGQGVTQYNRSLLVLEAVVGQELDVVSNLAPTVALFRFGGSLNGSAWLAGFEGHLGRGGSSVEAAGTLLELEGAFDLESSADQESGSTRWRLIGEPSAVRLDTGTLEIAALPGKDIVVKSTLIGAILSFTGWAFWNFRDAILAIFQHTKADPLGHPLRRRLLDLVKEGPTTKQSLARRVSRPKQLVDFHLRVLERNRMTSRVSSGPADVFISQNDGAGISGPHPSLNASEVLAASHPLRAFIVSYLSRVDVAGYEEISHAARKCPDVNPPTRRAIAYHASLLARKGVVRRLRNGRDTRLTLSP